MASREPVELEDFAHLQDSVRLADVPQACGLFSLACARGANVMSNIFLSTALIYLASESVGCVTRDKETGDMVVDEACEEEVYGLFRPAALMTNIGAISGLLAALLMPLIGAIIDFTDYRRTVGICASVFIVVSQATQIFTTSRTWFAMAILQAFWGCSYQVLTLTSYAYLPDIVSQVDEKTMARFTPLFTMGQFGSQVLFLVLVSTISIVNDLNDVEMARMSQALVSVVIILPLVIGWKRLPPVKARNKLEDGKGIIRQGLAQNWNTAKLIRRDYSRSLRWFLWGAIFSEPAAGAFTTVSVVFLMNHLGMTSSQVGITFFLVLVAMIPGGLVSTAISTRTNANTATRASLLFIFTLSVFGALCISPENKNPVAYIWAFFLGLALGTYYPSLKLFLSMVVPKSKEAEVVGFYINCSQLLAWLPPLVFSALVEAGVDIGIGLIVMGSFSLIAVALFSMAAPFNELLEEVRLNDKYNVTAETKAATPELPELQ